MKILKGIILTSIISLFFGVSQASAGVNDFHFSDFTADYYLSKDDEGISRLRVVESLTAEFPDYKQNKGICREIPYTANAGKNLTLESLTRSEITVTRNGKPEPIYSIEKQRGKGSYRVCTGTEEYVLGTQVYTFEYTFKNVIMSFEENGKKWQELYWDTNGTGWSQRFDNVTARLHFEDKDIWNGEKWCYVGVQGSNNQSRCEMGETPDGAVFVTKDLLRGENLTFVVIIKDDSFVVIPPKENYIFPIGVAIVSIICLLGICSRIKKFNAVKEKREFYKSCFVVPQYEPFTEYDYHTQAHNYIGSTGNPSVSTIIQLVLDGKIELIKGEKKFFGGYKWSVHVKSTDGLLETEKIILEILNGGNTVHKDDTIQLKRHYSSTHLQSLGRRLSKHGEKNAELCGLAIKDKSKTLSVATSLIVWMCVCMFSPAIISGVAALLVATDFEIQDGQIFVGFKESIITGIVVVILTLIICSILRNNTYKFAVRTEKGLKDSRYLDGLKLYIKMAEADRIKFMQSVPNADVSPEGIVKIYEKLLPHAILFKLEDTWLKDMEEYCVINNIDTSSMNISTSDIVVMHSFIHSIPYTTNFGSTGTSISSSSSSSGSSGGGGGGFSGGGGGGGGGGGR